MPLSPLHPESSIKYFIEDSDARLLLADSSMAVRLRPLAAGRDPTGPRLLLVEDAARQSAANDTNTSA